MASEWLVIPSGHGEWISEIFPSLMKAECDHLYEVLRTYDADAIGKSVIGKACASSGLERMALVWYRLAADEGHFESQVIVGQSYENGITVKANMEEAIKWYGAADRAGILEGSYQLGRCYADGIGVGKDDVEAFHLFGKAAVEGHAAAELALAKCYKLGKGVDQDEGEAENWMLRAAERGDRNALYEVGILSEERRATSKDDEDQIDEEVTMEWFRAAARQGHREAMYRLALYCEARPDDSDVHREAFRLFEESASLGMVDAQLKLARVKSRAGNLTEAIEWYQKAADAGSADALVRLGLAYEKGEGAKQELKLAFECYSVAHTKGSLEGAFQMARCYQKGIGVATDLEHARGLLQSLVSCGFSEASRMEVEVTEEIESRKLILQLAESGAPDALYELGKRYFYGTGGFDKDETRGKALIQKASKQGSSEGKLWMAIMEPDESNYEVLVRAAIDGHARAQLACGIICEARCKDMGVKSIARTEIEGLSWYRLAADQRVDDAEFRLSKWLRRGCLPAPAIWKELEKPWTISDVSEYLETHKPWFAFLPNEAVAVSRRRFPDEAILLLTPEAARGTVRFQVELARVFEEEGRRAGNKTAMSKAVKWFKVAAEQGNDEANIRLALIHSTGDLGMPRDILKAKGLRSSG